MGNHFPDHLEPVADKDLPDLRAEVRSFLDREVGSGTFRPGHQDWTTPNAAFSARCAERGYVAMTWPVQFGGRGRSALERNVVCEEMVAASAPVGFHWIADRQSGPQIIRNGSDALKAQILPKIASGTCCFCIGMSEPDSGSDLSSVKTRADRVEGGWSITGRKVWTTNAHIANYMIVLCRTSGTGNDRHKGLSQIVVPLDADGVTVLPIVNLAGEHELNEVVFDAVFVADDYLLGREGDGWRLVTEELGFERSGPDRYLTTFPVLAGLLNELGPAPDKQEAQAIGRMVARLSAVRNMSAAIASALERREPVTLTATVMKELGTTLEQQIPVVAQDLAGSPWSMPAKDFAEVLARARLKAPSFSLRGGSREILKNILAKELMVS